MGFRGKISAVLAAAAIAFSTAAPAYAGFVFNGEEWIWQWDIIEEAEEVEDTPVQDDVVEDIPVEVEEEDEEEDLDWEWSNNLFPRTDYKKLTYLESFDDGIKVGIKSSDVSRCKFYLYDKKKGKYVFNDECDPQFFENLLFNGSLVIDGLKAGTTYKIKLVSYGKNGKKLRTEYLTAKTLSKAPQVVIKNNGKKATVSWKALQPNAKGYEIYKKKAEKASGGTIIHLTQPVYNLKNLEKDGFKLSTRKTGKTSGKITLKSGSGWEYSIRTFKIVNGKRVYSGFSEPLSTESLEAYLNSKKAVSHEYSSGEELKLVKKYVAQVTTKGMTNAEKMKAIFDLCNSHGTYQNDIYKIDAKRPVWQLMVKGEGQCATWAYSLHSMLEYAGIDCRVVRGLRSSGQQHFWCQVKINGSWYDLDAHLGTYLSKYDGDYMGYVIQDYSG